MQVRTHHMCRFSMAAFSMTLNDLPAGLASKLPSTDTRLRADLQALEQGRNAEASPEMNTDLQPC